MNERTKGRFEVVATSYGRNKNLDEEINKHNRKNSGSDSKRQTVKNKTVIAAEAITICIKPLTHYLLRSDLVKLVKLKPLSPRETKGSKIFILLKTFGNVKIRKN